MLEERQKYYLDILALVLPYARNVQTWGVVDRVFKLNLYPELERVHNIPPLVCNCNYSMQDVYWLNTQAKNDLIECDKKERPHSECIRANILKIANSLPVKLKDKLDYKINNLLETSILSPL
ncbi:MAG TPA: hypothetical protein ENF20_09355 [Candidatus Marinimicrobia bacterium]|nr:hypothetical protein [Candidatus Neomarinimicrobiota bacterium]